MRGPHLRRKRRDVLDLGDVQNLRQQTYLVAGRRYIIDRWTLNWDGGLDITLVDEAAFIERNEIRQEQRGLVEMVRRWREHPDPAGPPER